MIGSPLLLCTYTTPSVGVCSIAEAAGDHVNCLPTDFASVIVKMWGRIVASLQSVRLVDLDGDKRADYVIIYDGGAVKALGNSGNLNKDANKRNWHDLGTIAPGVSSVTRDMIRFADMN
ncbi:hypothetical protein VE03_01481 [Pseudogymnoascus sp. 23342-1-I1]|nr:hypothetical protein VE03_01481 [Pseudogymnoascus sp. 23342-1-I1]